LAVLLPLASAWLAHWSCRKLLAPKPKFALHFSSGQAEGVSILGSQLVVHVPTPGDTKNYFTSNNRGILSYHSLEDGAFLFRHETELAKSTPAPNCDGLPVAKGRYRLETIREKILLFDNQTGRWHHFHTRGPDELDAYQYAGLADDSVILTRRRLPVELLFPPTLGAGAATPVVWGTRSFSLSGGSQTPMLLEVLRVPDRKILSQLILSPCRYPPVAGVSPSGRYLLLRRHDFKSTNHSPNPFAKVNATRLPELYDFQHKTWASVNDACEQFNFYFGPASFVSDDFALGDVPSRAASNELVSGLLHVPTGIYLDTLDIPPHGQNLRVIRNDSGVHHYARCSLTPEQSWLLELVAVGPGGQSDVVGQLPLSGRTHPWHCAGRQTLIHDPSSGKTPELLKRWITEIHTQEKVADWLNPLSQMIYDWDTGQTALRWARPWHGHISRDGKHLILWKTRPDAPRNVLQADVYDLPLPVRSPWWPRLAALVAGLLALSVLLRRSLSPPRSRPPTLASSH
jgi:hypothetical protein